MSQPPSIRPGRKQTGVPRRFGMGVLLVITTMYAVLFAALQRFPPEAQGYPHEVFLAVVAFFTGVGVAQTVLYHGRNPRRASIISGIVLGGLIALVTALIEVHLHAGWFHRYWWYYLTVWILLPTAGGTLLGGPLGYLAGGLIAGVFLLFNKWQPPLGDEEVASLEKE